MTQQRKPAVYRQGESIYVIGTEDTYAACRAAEITPETHQWVGTDFGHFVRRANGWEARSEATALPKDARVGVCFRGPIRRQADDPARLG